MTKHNNDMSLKGNLLSTITRMHSNHLILAVVCDRFFFMKASHLNWPLTNRPAAMMHVCLYCATNAIISHSSSVNAPAASPYSTLHNLGLYTSSRLETVGFFNLCRRFLHHFLNFSGHVLQFSERVYQNFSSHFFFLIFASSFQATNCIVSSLVSSYDGRFSRGRYAAGRSQ